MQTSLPTLCTIIVTILFLVLERIFPGRELPNSKGWYARVLLINLCQLVITLLTNKLWVNAFSSFSILRIAKLNIPILEGFIGWFVGTFFFYWWHRLRHQ